MGDYKLKIGNTNYAQEVKGTDDWSETISRDFNDKILRVKGNYKFTGFKALYETIYTSLIANGVCEALEGRVYYRGNPIDAYDEVWRGEIKPQDGQFDLLNYAVDTQILDNSWSAKFNNSQDQKVFMRSDTSKNGVQIPLCTINPAEFYDPTDGSALPDTRATMKVFDVLKFLVAYYTDDTVTFASTFFDTGGDGEQYHITTGYELRVHDQSINPELSFSEVFDELNKKFDLWIVIEGTLDAPVLRVEQRGYSLDDIIAIEVENPEAIIMKTDLEQLYTVIKVGATVTEYDPAADAHYPYRRFTDWNEEQYNTSGSCEFENSTLDLVSIWKIDTNSIEYALDINASGNEDLDNDVFLVEVDVNNFAIKFDNEVTSGTTDLLYFYNYNLTNEQVILNWFDSIPSIIRSAVTKDYYVYADGLTGFDSGPWFSYNAAVPFENDSTAPGSDVDGIYYTPTDIANTDQWGTIDVPVTGIYNIETFVSFTYGGFDPYDIELSIQVWESGSTQPNPNIVIKKIIDNVYGQGGNSSVSGSTSVFAQAGQWILVCARVTTTFPFGSGDANLSGGYIKMNASPYTASAGSENPLIYLYDIKQFYLPEADYETLKTNKTQQVRFIDTLTNREWTLWPKEMQYNRERQLVEVGEFIGKLPTNPLCWIMAAGAWEDSCYWVDGASWIDCGINVVSNPYIASNPVSSWSLLLGTTQTGVRTFTDPAGGPLYDVYLRQTITLPAGSYIMTISASISSVDTVWGCEIVLSGSTGLGSLWGSAVLNQAISIPFTVTGSSSRILTARFFATMAASPTFTINEINIC